MNNSLARPASPFNGLTNGPLNNALSRVPNSINRSRYPNISFANPPIRPANGPQYAS